MTPENLIEMKYLSNLMLNFNAKTEIDKEKSESAILDTERIFSENSTTYAPYGNRGDKQYII